MFRKALLTGAVLLASSAPVFASTVSFSTAFGPQTTDFTDNLSISGFNSALGTLTGVSVTLTSNATASGTVKNTAAGAQTFNVTESIELDSSSSVAGLSGLVNTLSATQHYASLAAGATANFGPYTPSGTQSANPTDLADFIGSSLSFQVSTLTGTTVAGGGGNIQSNIATTAGGTLSVTYTYSVPPPPTVPEPASIALLGAGLLGLGIIRRKKA